MQLIQVFFRATRLLAVLMFGLAAPAFADQGLYPQTDEEKQAAYDALQWHTEPQSYALEHSHAHVKLSQDRVLLLGSDARRLSWLISGVEFPDTEAILSL